MAILHVANANYFKFHHVLHDSLSYQDSLLLNKYKNHIMMWSKESQSLMDPEFYNFFCKVK